MRRDAVIAIVLIAVALAAVGGVWSLEGGARDFPLSMAGILSVGALLLLGQSVSANKSAEGEDSPLDYGRLLSVAATTLGFALVMPWIGFYPATFVYLASLYCWLSELRAPVAVGLAAALTLAIYVLFDFFLAVPTPDGVIASILLG